MYSTGVPVYEISKITVCKDKLTSIDAVHKI